MMMEFCRKSPTSGNKKSHAIENNYLTDNVKMNEIYFLLQMAKYSLWDTYGHCRSTANADDTSDHVQSAGRPTRCLVKILE